MFATTGLAVASGAPGAFYANAHAWSLFWFNCLWLLRIILWVCTVFHDLFWNGRIRSRMLKNSNNGNIHSVCSNEKSSYLKACINCIRSWLPDLSSYKR